MSTTTEFERGQIIAYYQTGTMSHREIAEAVRKDRRTVDRIIKRFEERGNTDTDFLNCGRPRVTTERLDRTLIRLSKAAPRSSSRDLADQLAGEYGVTLDSSTVRRRLLEAGRPAVRPITCPVLTPAMREKRLRWAKEHSHWTVNDWSKVMFTDETCVEVQPLQSQYVRRSVGEVLTEDHFVAKFRHPVKVMIWGCLSVHGTGRIHIVEGSMNKEQYLKVLEHRVLPQARDWWPGEPWILQHDLAPCHTARVCKAFLDSRNVNVLDWPGNSPDLNVIENLWHILKRQINKNEVKNRHDVIKQCVDILMRSDELRDICKKLVESMPRRVVECIKAKGGPLVY